MEKQNILFMMLLVAFTITSCQNKQTQKQEPLSVETMMLDYTSDISNQQYVGQVEEQSSTSVSFAAMGTLQQVLVIEGQRVVKGQLVAVIDEQSALSALASAKAQLDQAKDALERMKMLYDTNSLPEIKWVETQSQAQQAQAQYDLMKKQLSDCRLTAPCSGIVGSDVKNVGEVAVPSATILNILDINKVKVKVNIPGKELSALKSGTTAQITCEALPGKIFHSSSFVKSVQADAITHTYEAYFWVNNPSGDLLPGMVCQVSLSPAVSNGDGTILAVPIRCVQQSADGKEFVWLARNGKAHRQDVALGETLGNNIVVTSGLKKGDKVIIAGYQKVSEGSEIK